MIDIDSSNLKTLFKDGHALAEEMQAMDAKEQDARRSLAEAAKKGGIESPKVQRAIGDARMLLDFIASRRTEVAKEQRANLSALSHEYVRLRSEWNSAVRSRADALVAKLTEVLGSLGVGRVGDCVRTISNTQWPALHEVRRCLWSLEGDADNMLQAIESFLAHVRRKANVVYPKPENTQVLPR